MTKNETELLIYKMKLESINLVKDLTEKIIKELKERIQEEKNIVVEVLNTTIN